MPTKTFELNLIQGRPIIEDNGNVILIDTGLLYSLHSKRTLNFMNYDFEVKVSNTKLDKLRNLLDSRITTVLAMDKLKYYKIVFDYPNKRISFSNKNEFNFEGESINFNPKKGLPIFEATINQNTIPLLLDTSANLSFINSVETQNLNKVEEMSDYYPIIPWLIKTAIYEIETNLGSKKIVSKFGNLPPHFDSQLTKSGFGYIGVIGYDLLKNYKIYMDIFTRELKLADSSPDDIQIADDFENELPDCLTSEELIKSLHLRPNSRTPFRPKPADNPGSTGSLLL